MDFGQEYRAKSADTLCGLSLVSTSSDQVLAAAGGKNIRLHSPSTLSCLSTIGLQDTVRSIAASSADPNILWSASDDGVVRGWDVRYPKKEAMKKFSPTSRTGQLSSVACCGETGRVAAGTEAIKVEGEDAASVLLWDVRGGGAVMEYDEAHSDTITNLCFSPSDKKYLCSGSLDGLVCIIDTSVADPDDTLESVLNAESSVSQAGFFGPVSEYAYCLTLTETVLFWHIDEAQQLGHHGDVRQTLKENSNITVNYLVDCFYQASSTQLTATAGNHSGELFLLNVNLDGVHLIKSLPKRHQTTVCCMSYDHANQVLFTGDDSGSICSWSEGGCSSKQTAASSPEENQPSSQPASKVNAPKTEPPSAEAATGSANRQTKMKQQHKSGRKFKPY